MPLRATANSFSKKNDECSESSQMCIIVDTNVASNVFESPPRPDYRPVIDWLSSPQKPGILVIGGMLARELNRTAHVRRFVMELQRAGRVRRIPDSLADAESKAVRAMCKSDDPHVIALARLSGSRLLCSRDKKLHVDFTNPSLVSNPKGHVYQNERHSSLLTRFGHTIACRRSTGLTQK
jgi:hypothetical protein